MIPELIIVGAEVANIKKQVDRCLAKHTLSTCFGDISLELIF